MYKETFELAIENNLSIAEAEELQKVVEETGLEGEEALWVWSNL